jgi:hypothetical protein
MLPQSILKQIVKKRPYVIQSIKTHMKQDKKKKKKKTNRLKIEYWNWDTKLSTIKYIEGIY